MAQSVLLGLGGTGSRIVNYVATELRKKRIGINDGKICCAVIDTNNNDQKDLKSNGAGIPVIATSKERIIDSYMKMYKSQGVDDWMPISEQLLRESMLDGASQMRSKSRLAFYDTVESGTIRELEKEMEKLFNDRDEGKMRVMIVSSLAGGTGAGMFIQTALWVRQFFKKRNTPVTIRGILVLPDVFIRTISQISADPTEVRSLRANAYGAIRELNALTLWKTKKNAAKPPVQVKLDELFDSNDPADGEPVFNFAFFMDDVTDTGSALKTIVDYEKAVARLTYMQLFAPIDDDMNSEEDNLFKRIQAEKDPIYGSCGTAKAMYPVDSILSYCSLRAAQDSLSTGWRKIDEEIKVKQGKEKEREKKGAILTTRLNPRTEYVRLFEEKCAKTGDQIGRDRLFVNIAADVKNEEISISEDGADTVTYSDKVDDFRVKMDDLIRNAIASANPGKLSDIKIKDERESWETDDSELNTKDTIKEFVSNKKRNVERFMKELDRTIEEIAENVIGTLCPNDIGDVNSHNLSSLIGLFTKVDKNNEMYFVHPIAVRYLLYKLANVIDGFKEIASVNKARQAAQEGQGDGIAAVSFDNEKTRGVETIDSYLDNKPLFKSEAKHFQDFKGLYYDFNKGQAELCKRYAEKAVRQKVATLLAARIETITKIVEGFFSSLDKVYDKMDEDIAKNIRETEDNAQKIFYICASGEEKESLYSSLNFNTGNSNRNINEIIVDAFYKQFCVKDNPEAEANKKFANQSVITVFFKEVLKTYREIITRDYSEEIDLDIYSAVCKSADIEYKKSHANEVETDELGEIDDSGEIVVNDAKHQRHVDAMKSLAEKLRKNSAPFLLIPDDIMNDTQKTMTFWGFSPALSGACPELGEILNINVKSQADAAYAKNELDCYRAAYGIRAKDITKFNEENKEDNDNYYASYEEIINTMIDGVANGDESILVQTPHLDKTWHNVLPYVTSEMQQKAEAEFYKSFWLALAYGMITLDKSGKYQIKRVVKTKMGTTSKRTVDVMYKGEIIVAKEVWKLLASLRTDSAFLKDVDEYKKMFEEECENINTYERTVFLRGEEKTDITAEGEDGSVAKTSIGGVASKTDTNALTIIVRYSLTPKCDTEVLGSLVEVLDNLCGELIKGKYTSDDGDKIENVKIGLYERIQATCQMSKTNIPQEVLDKWFNK